MFELAFYIFIYGVGGLLLTEVVGTLVHNPLRWPLWGRALLGPFGVFLLIIDAFMVSPYYGDDE